MTPTTATTRFAERKAFAIAAKSPRYGTPEWDAAVADERTKIEAAFKRHGSNGTGRSNYGRGSFEGVL